YWHGKYLIEGRYIPKTNTEFWINKITKNIERDRQVNEELKAQGWTIIRFWGEEISKDLENCIEKIIETLNK
ncbi:MAG: DUF559 domain-containing protein, partial [Candidatus Cloacimonadota bacterium]|nr:DUF559 domain-containing protein [Candidatus Cloacimonadota bacterium]